MTLSGGRKSKKTSWIDFVKKVQNDEGISFKEAMSKASQLKKQGKMKGGDLDSDGAMDVVVDEDEVMETSPTSPPMDDVNMIMDVEEDSDSSSPTSPPMVQEGGKKKSKKRTGKRSKRKGKGKSNKKSKKRTKRSKSRRRKQKK